MVKNIKFPSQYKLENKWLIKDGPLQAGVMQLWESRFTDFFSTGGYPSEVKAKSHPHRGTKAGGGGVGGISPLGFCCVSIIRKDFAFDRKPLMCFTI